MSAASSAGGLLADAGSASSADRPLSPHLDTATSTFGGLAGGQVVARASASEVERFASLTPPNAPIVIDPVHEPADGDVCDLVPRGGAL